MKSIMQDIMETAVMGYNLHARKPVPNICLEYGDARETLPEDEENSEKQRIYEEVAEAFENAIESFQEDLNLIDDHKMDRYYLIKEIIQEIVYKAEEALDI